MNTDVAPPLAANMSAAFKKVRGAIGATDPDLAELIVDRGSLQKLAFTTLKSCPAGRSPASSRQSSADWCRFIRPELPRPHATSRAISAGHRVRI
jgi:hypothetical protein